MRFSLIAALSLGLLVTANCGGGGDDDDDTVDAFVIADANMPDATPPTPDAPPANCTTPAFIAGDLLTAGAVANLYGVGPGAWAHRANDGIAPGEILYLEAYRDLITGDTETQTEFLDWYASCNACIFFGQECATYAVTLDPESGLPPIPSTDCAKLFMLEKGTVTFSSLDTTPASGSLTGSVAPNTGESVITFVEIYATGDPSTATGYGNALPDGECLEFASLAFDGTWG
ncbi:MAG: hypothetical protein JRF63_08490, partial [Deltaproteobacteria bacterium]|nr:hypothetical protein [Deltaproteobacteria bacterium]